MIKSMTGFGRCETAENNRKFTVEMKSVNHRYLDVNIKMPKKLNFFESAIRSELKNYISRGKVDLFITYEDFSENTSNVRYNKELAAEYLGYLKQLASDFDYWPDRTVTIPNKEVSQEYVNAISTMNWSEVIRSVDDSRKLLKALWEMDADTVAAGIDRAHREISILQYNDENSLRERANNCRERGWKN